MKTNLIFAVTLLIGLISSTWGPSIARGQAGSDAQHEVLKMDVGVWQAQTKLFAGPGEPEMSEGVERNRMIGDSWLVSNFKGEFAGMDFTGHGTTGFDAKTKKYVTHWVDSMSAYRSIMTGTYDNDSKTMTFVGNAHDPDGNPVKSKNVIVYKDDGSRVLTMYSQMPGSEELTKTMEIVYTKKKKAKKAKQ